MLASLMLASFMLTKGIAQLNTAARSTHITFTDAMFVKQVRDMVIAGADVNYRSGRVRTAMGSIGQDRPGADVNYRSGPGLGL